MEAKEERRKRRLTEGIVHGKRLEKQTRSRHEDPASERRSLRRVLTQYDVGSTSNVDERLCEHEILLIILTTCQNLQ